MTLRRPQNPESGRPPKAVDVLEKVDQTDDEELFFDPRVDICL